MANKIIDNRYEIINKIGIGGFAVVYKAWARNLEKFVALKKIHDFYVDDDKLLAMFKREAVNTAKLEHENIVRVIDYIKTGGDEYWIVMDYVKGNDLEAIIKGARKAGTKIPPTLSVYIVLEVLKALEYAHFKRDDITGNPLNVVHRDISPGNIMVCSDGKVKIADFGIARVETGGPGVTKTGSLKGKISYMSPEQAGGGRGIDRRTDIYSLGIVLWEMLTGRKMYEGDTDLEILQKVKKIEVNYRSIPEELRQVVAKALHKDRNRRYQNAGEMSVVLQKYLSGAKSFDGQEELKEFTGQFIKEDDEDEGKGPGAIDKAGFPAGKVKKITRSRAGGNRGITFKIIATLLLAVIVFSAYDVLNRKTWYGNRLNSILFSQGFIIDTVPRGAEVFLSGKGREVIITDENRTPLLIEKVLPGEYVLRLEKSGFEPVTGKITVEEKGDIIASKGSSSMTRGRKRFTFPFILRLSVNSIPEGAVVSVNGEVKGRAPLVCRIPAGETSVSMSLEGFGPIGATGGTGKCIINTLNKVDEQPGLDSRYWEFSIDDSAPKVKAILTGTFYRNILVNSDPVDASVYMDDVKEPVGITPLENFFIKPGRHRIRIEKYGYVSWNEVIDVNAKEDISLCPALKKKIRVYAYEKDSSGKDINARVAIEGTGVKRRKTPFSYSLVPGTYVMKFSKPGYKSLRKKINVRDLYRVRVELSPEARQSSVYDGTLVVDTRPHYTGSKIFIDGKLLGDTVRKIKELERCSHTVTVKHPDLPEPAVKQIAFSRPQQSVILKMDESGRIYEK